MYLYEYHDNNNQKLETLEFKINFLSWTWSKNGLYNNFEKKKEVYSYKESWT